MMRKLLALIMVMIGLAAQNAHAEAFLTPDPSKTYMIQHSSTLFMTVSGNSLKIMSAGTGDSQKFTFELVEGTEATYNIKLENGKYLGSDNGWTAVFLDDPTDPFTHFTFWQSYIDDKLCIYNEGRKGYFGTDNNQDGGGIYTNKGNNDGKYLWKFVEATDGLLLSGLEEAIASAETMLAESEITEAFPQAAVDVLTAAIATGKAALQAETQAEVNQATDTLNALINAMKTFRTTLANAIETVANAKVGNEAGAYPQEAVEAFNTAIDTAKAAWADGNTEKYNQANSALNEAISAFASSCFVFVPETGKKYYLINTNTQLMMGISSGNEVILDEITGADNQKFEIIPVEGSNIAFNLKIADGSGYVARKGNWNTTVVADPNVDEAKIDFEIWDLDNKVYTLKKFNAWGYMAADGSNPGDLVYTDKSNYHNRAQWQIKEAVDGELLTDGFDNAVATAEDYIAKAVVGEEPGNYPQEALDALKAALAAAKAHTAATQAELNEVVRTLNAAIAAFVAEKIDPYFVPRENTAYRFSVRKYIDKYLTNTDGNASKTSTFAAGATGQHWTFQPVADKKHTFIVKNDGKVLNYDATLTETADADAPLWTVVYTTTAGNLDYFALVEYDDPTKVLTFSSGNTWSIQNLDKGNNAHQARFLRVDAANDPNLYNLEVAVANARATLDNIDRGNEIGQWSDAKCDAFAAVIAAADALTGATQEEVDAKVTELNNARTDFINNPNSVIKDELDAAIAAAKAKAAAAEIGVAVGQYYESAIEAFETKVAEFEAAAKTVTDQVACDALTEEVKQATEAFAGHTEVQPAADVLNDVIACAEALYEAEKDNVGSNMGQRPQEAVDAFAAAIATAKAVSNPTVADIEALLDARTAFLAGAVSVNRTPLRKAIEAASTDKYANLKGGDFDGYYPQEAIDAFRTALANAIEAEADMTKTQQEIDACTKALTDAMSNLNKVIVKIKFADLDRELAAAQAALNSVTEIGSEEGKCPQAVIDALNAVINEAKAVDRAAINQASVDALAAKLAQATAKFNTDLVASTGISATIVDAQALVNGAKTGFKPGNYPASAVADLSMAIQNALLVAENTTATQAQLIAAVKALKAAMEDFKTQVIPALDLTLINQTIAEAEAFIAEHGNADYVLAIALQEAKDIVADADNHTKSEIAKAQENLAKALKFARETEGVEDVSGENLAIRANIGNVIVEGLPSKANIAVYTIDGRMVAYAETFESTYSVALAAGKYVVVVKSETFSVCKLVIVK